MYRNRKILTFSHIDHPHPADLLIEYELYHLAHPRSISVLKFSQVTPSSDPGHKDRGQEPIPGQPFPKDRPSFSFWVGKNH